MAIFEIPLRTDLTDYEFTINLDNANYVFRFLFNNRDNAWYFNISLPNGTPLILSTKVVVDWPLARRCRAKGHLPGLLVAQDASGKQVDAGIHDLGGRVKLFYFDLSELL